VLNKRKGIAQSIKEGGRRDLPPLLLSDRSMVFSRIMAIAGEYFLFTITSLSIAVILFIFYFITRDALPFFEVEGFKEFFASSRWYPSAKEAEFGALAIFIGSGLVTAGAVCFAVPVGIAVAVCLSDIIPFALRQLIKPIIEILAAIPSVAYGFFALVIFAPVLQEKGGTLLSLLVGIIGVPAAFILTVIFSDFVADKFPEYLYTKVRLVLWLFCGVFSLLLVAFLTSRLHAIKITTGTNILNVSIILGIMALPTIISVSEDALQAVGRELREASYALGATRAETMIRTVLPAAGSGILAAVILGIMRALGETMVVWMASGNAAQIPSPWYNFLMPIRTLTATIAGEMGEADHVTGSSRYHVLFAMALCLLIVSFLLNMTSEYVLLRYKKKMGK